MLKSKTDIGKMDKRITIIKKVITIDSTYNTEVETWVLHKLTWAQEDAGLGYGTEIIQADKNTATRRSGYVVRYDSTINEKMRIVFDGKVYDIVSVKLPDANRKRFLKLDCDYLEGVIWT